MDARRTGPPITHRRAGHRRIETGHRRLAIDNLTDLARAFETTVDEILGSDDDENVVIRPTRSKAGNSVVHWPLTRLHDPSGRTVAKMRIPASKKRPDRGSIRDRSGSTCSKAPPAYWR